MTIEPGEAWTMGALEDLRKGSYRPAAWAHFLRASLSRASEVRHARPELAHQAARWGSASVVISGVARESVAVRGLPAPPRGRALCWWTATGLMLRWHLGMVENASGEVRPLSAGDALTLLRLALVPFAVAAAPSQPLFVTLLAASAATDLGDGPLARRVGATRLGRDLDPAADIAFLLAATRAARRARWLPRPAAGLIAVRSVAPAAALAVGYFKDARRLPAEHFGDTSWTSPLIYGGLAAAALGRRRVGVALVATGSLAAIASWQSALHGAPNNP
jgi:phosphatidylglycerophosphate synthase